LPLITACPGVLRNHAWKIFEYSLERGHVATSKLDLTDWGVSLQLDSALRVHVISPRTGKPFLEHMTKVLATAVQNGLLPLQELGVPFLADKITGMWRQSFPCCLTSLDATISDPELLVVVGGRMLKLQGFPPWQLRLTEL
jgi:undecaprenyl pyrophosphate synthase